AQSRLQSLRATDGALMDLDFTGKLDLLAISEDANDLRIFRQFGPLLFSETTSTAGVPASLRDARGIDIVDWNRDQVTDVIVTRASAPPLLLEKQRGGP